MLAMHPCGTMLFKGRGVLDGPGGKKPSFGGKGWEANRRGTAADKGEGCCYDGGALEREGEGGWRGGSVEVKEEVSRR